MGIADVNPKLPSNRLIFDIRRDDELMNDFHTDMDAVFDRYGLSDAERAAWRELNLQELGRLGVHPYFLPQVSRIFRGSAYNHNNSEAAQLYAKTMVAEADAKESNNG